MAGTYFRKGRNNNVQAKENNCILDTDTNRKYTTTQYTGGAENDLFLVACISIQTFSGSTFRP
jgi:hypothetical protein